MSLWIAALTLVFTLAVAALVAAGGIVVVTVGARALDAVAPRLLGRWWLAWQERRLHYRRQRRAELEHQRRRATWRQDGMDDVYNLRGVHLRLTPHELVVEGWFSERRIGVHELLGAWRKERVVMLIGIGGEEIALGSSRSTLDSLNAAIQGLTEGIQRRRRGTLEDKVDMEVALHGARTQAAV